MTRTSRRRALAATATSAPLLLLTGLLLLASTADAFLECRQPNYVTKNGKIVAVDPKDATETPIKIKGVAWSGMEKLSMIPDGLWGTETPTQGMQATTVKKVLEFMTNNSFNALRLPLNAEYVTNDPKPQLAYIHAYENREFSKFDDPNSVRYLDLVGRVVQTFQNAYVTVLLDIHLLDKYDRDAYWYTAPFVNITDAPVYKAVTYLAKTLCNAGHWNIIGVDLKDEMLAAQWPARAEDASAKTDWRQAAEVLANRVVELCPQWLVFVGGASSSTPAQRFKAGEAYKELSDHWDGGNLKNATLNPIKMAVANKLVYAPHAHAHGVYPRNYFFSPASNCSLLAAGSSSADDTSIAAALEAEQLTSECVDFTDGGVKAPTKLKCSKSRFACQSYAHLPKAELVAQYRKVMDEAVGAVVAEGKDPVVLGSFSGVYGPGQPQQTAALEYLIEYAAGVQGGYFWALNPDSEYYLEDAVDKKAGVFGRTHYGVMKTTSWQQTHDDLVAALAKIPSSDVPCYGGVAKKAPSASSSAGGASRLGASPPQQRMLTAALVVASLALFFAM